MIEPHWKRIAGLHCLPDGDFAAVWMARDGDNDVIHLYDACMFKREVLAVIAESLNARGRWVPVAWQNKEFAGRLLDRGCNMLPEKTPDTDEMAEVISRDIWERMRSGRFKVDRRLQEWLEEFKTFKRDEQKVPRETHPLMSATRHAMGQIEFARAERAFKESIKTYPKLAMI